MKVELTVTVPDDWKASTRATGSEAARYVRLGLAQYIGRHDVKDLGAELRHAEELFTVRGTRYQRGMTPIRPSRPVYGWKIRCTYPTTDAHPEFTRRVNGTKAEARQAAKDHLRFEHGVSRGLNKYLEF